MILAFVFVGLPEGILIFILSGLIVFFGSRALLRKVFKSLSAKRILTFALLASLFLNPVFLFVVINTAIYYTPENRAMMMKRMEYEKKYLEEKDKQFTDASILGKTKEEIIEEFGRTDTTENSIIYNYSTFTSTFVVEIELEDGKAVRINKKKE